MNKLRWDLFSLQQNSKEIYEKILRMKKRKSLRKKKNLRKKVGREVKRGVLE